MVACLQLNLGVRLTNRFRYDLDPFDTIRFDTVSEASDFRLFVYRNDESGDARGVHGLEAYRSPFGQKVYKPADYSPQGRRLIPIAIALEVASIALGVATVIWFARAA